MRLWPSLRRARNHATCSPQAIGRGSKDAARAVGSFAQRHRSLQSASTTGRSFTTAPNLALLLNVLVRRRPRRSTPLDRQQSALGDRLIVVVDFGEIAMPVLDEVSARIGGEQLL